jgi:anaerobic selenocysteine-containing dehydrogenase
LRRHNGIQWPCNAEHPDGAERLYTDLLFNTETDYCETWGHDLQTGAVHERKDHAALETRGRAILHPVPFEPAAEPVDDDYPFVFTTGRTYSQFHTRTKTGRAPELRAAAPEAWLEIAAPDAAALGVDTGDLVEVTSHRGRLELVARVGPIRSGVVFAPFHYGYWDERRDGGDPDEPVRAANELTITEWDPVSKQPVFKTAAVRVRRLRPAKESS